jgi:hypothetical protein
MTGLKIKMWYVAILFIIIFIIVAWCLNYACRHCYTTHLNTYAILIWAWLVTLVLFAAFGVFVTDDLDQVMYAASITSIAGLFFVVILLWTLIDTYGYVVDIHHHLKKDAC